MIVLSFSIACLAVVSASTESTGTDMIMNILKQFLIAPTSDRPTTTEKTGLLPKILNPLHWITSFENIPWNPDSELTTVRMKKKMKSLTGKFRIY